MIGEEPEYSRLAARLLAAYIDKEVRGQGIASFSQAVAPRPRRGADRRRDGARSSRTTPASSTSPSTRTPTAGSSTSGCAPSTTATCCATPPAGWSSRPRSTCCCGWPAACRRTPAEAIGFYRLMSLAGLPAAARRRCSTPAPGTPRCPPATCVDSPRDELDSIYDRYAQVAKLSKFAGGIGIAWSRVRSPRRADPRHQRPVQRHRAVAAHAGRLGRRGQPGRPAQGRRLRLPGAVAPRHRGVPRAARQHRRGRPAHAQPQPGQLDPGRVHAPGRGRRDVVADRPGRGARAARPVGRRVRRGVPRRPRREGRYVRQVPARDLYGADDAHPRPDRQRLDDVQGRRQPHVQPDRRGRATSCTCPTCAPRSSRCPPTTRPPSATSARSTWRRHLRDGDDRLGAAARHGAHRGAVPRPGHRHQLLPERAGGGVQPALAAGRARA